MSYAYCLCFDLYHIISPCDSISYHIIAVPEHGSLNAFRRALLLRSSRQVSASYVMSLLWASDGGNMAGYQDGRSQATFRSGLRWIEEIQDLGMYTWSPAGLTQKRRFSEVTAADVLQGLCDEDREPPVMVNTRGISMPRNFDGSPAPQNVPNVFPYDAGYMVPLYLASQRRGSLEGIDFLLGGSSLEILAHRAPIEAGTKYLTQRCPGTDVILLCKHKQYVQNYADIGFQFERLMTGRGISDKHDLMKTESLHIMRVAGFIVLFSADVDAVDECGCAVEMKTGNPKYFGTKVMFQMISSGARTLLSADINKRMHPPRLNAIKEIKIEQLVRSNSSLLLSAEKNISECFSHLKNSREIDENFATEIDFRSGELILKPRSDADLLPGRAEVERLLA